MWTPIVRTVTPVLFLALLTGLYAQERQPTASVTMVPRMVRINNTFRPSNGLPMAAAESVTFSIYKEEHEGTPLWQETQNVALDADGRYTALLGSSLADGMPLDLFTAGEPRWLGVQFNRPGESEQPRVLLASVPYALKASDADTLAGRPASSYLLDPKAITPDTAGAASPVAASATVKSLQPRVNSGSPGNLGVFTNSTDLGNSALYQNGSQIELVGAAPFVLPFDYFHVRFNDSSGGFTGYAVQNRGSGASSYSGMLFYDQNNLLGQFQGFNNLTHEYRINNIAPSGSINFMLGGSSKFLVANGGNIGIGTIGPNAALQVASGDVYVSNPGFGLILKAPNGTTCVRLGIDNGGNLTAPTIACP